MTNYLKTPQDPDGVSVPVQPSSFRNIDFSALEYSTMRNAVIEYVRTYYRDDFNDFVSANGFVMIAEILSYIGGILSMRGDILVNDSFLPTSQTTDAVINHIALIGQEMRRQTSATVEVECSVDRPVATDVVIQAGHRLKITGPDGLPLIYEVYAAPFDWTSSIVIPARKRAVIAWAIEGSFATDVEAVSAGGANQHIDVVNTDILNLPIMVMVGETEEEWSRVEVLEKEEPEATAFQVVFTEDGMSIRFGDDVNGKAPIAGQPIRVRYRTGGGIRGRIGTGAINKRSSTRPQPPATASVQLNFRNLGPSSGGYDSESLNDAKKRAPRTWSTHDNAVSDLDYMHLAGDFRHPVYGGVAKAAVSLHSSINANIVRLHVLAEGEDDLPTKPSLGLKEGLRTYLNDLNVLTDDIEVEDGEIKPVDVEVTVVVSKNADATIVKEQVDVAIDDFFSLDKWDMGQPLYVSNLYELMMSIDGVKFVNIFKPEDDILAEKEIGSEAVGVGFNELITLGTKNVKIYYEKG